MVKCFDSQLFTTMAGGIHGWSTPAGRQMGILWAPQKIRLRSKVYLAIVLTLLGWHQSPWELVLSLLTVTWCCFLHFVAQLHASGPDSMVESWYTRRADREPRSLMPSSASGYHPRLSACHLPIVSSGTEYKLHRAANWGHCLPNVKSLGRLK